MNQIEFFALGTPVKMEYTTKENVLKLIFAKVLCSNLKDEKFYSCVTPHGSIIKTHLSNLHALIDDMEISQLKELENNSFEIYNTAYNNLFCSHSNSGNN